MIWSPFDDPTKVMELILEDWRAEFQRIKNKPKLVRADYRMLVYLYRGIVEFEVKLYICKRRMKCHMN